VIKPAAPDDSNSIHGWTCNDLTRRLLCESAAAFLPGRFRNNKRASSEGQDRPSVPAAVRLILDASRAPGPQSGGCLSKVKNTPVEGNAMEDRKVAVIPFGAEWPR
jgi:hypothetical protein